MRSIWCTLVVLVLLAPLGAVGITATPSEAEIVAAPRAPASSVASARLVRALPPAIVVVPPRVAPRIGAVRRAHVVVVLPPVILADGDPSARPRDPPV